METKLTSEFDIAHSFNLDVVTKTGYANTTSSILETTIPCTTWKDLIGEHIEECRKCILYTSNCIMENDNKI